MNFDDGDYVVFDNTNQTGYNYSQDLNPDCPPPYYYQNLNNYEQNNNQNNYQNNYKKCDDIELAEDLFHINNPIYEEKQDVSTLINIYEKTEEKSGEFIDIHFRANLLPFRMANLSNMTSLNINKCILDEISYLPPVLEKFKCNNCGLKIVSCKTFPTTLIEMDLSNNDIELICDFEQLIRLKKLILDDNSLSYINDIPKSIEIISLKQNKLTKITFLMEHLKEVYLNKNQIIDIEELLDTIEILDISNNNIGMICLLPMNLRILNAYNCKLKKILCKFPPNLKKLDLFSNSLESVSDFPDSLEWVDLSSNDILYLPKNIKNLKYFDISNNPNLVIIPNDESWKDFMMGMQDNKQFMMNFDDSDKKSEEIYISSDVGTTSDDDTDVDTDVDESFNNNRFKQNLLNAHSPQFKPSNKENYSEGFNDTFNDTSNDTFKPTFIHNNNDNNDNNNNDNDNYATFSFNKNENDNDDRLKEIINNIRQMKHREKRFVKLYKSYTC
jgi:hypothetical protein